MRKAAKKDPMQLEFDFYPVQLTEENDDFCFENLNAEEYVVIDFDNLDD